ncbi:MULTISPECIES: acyltransferase family protein [Lentzea]|uniref:Acyltransferase n=1 Tax=Lentzea sokolovensis TaxID=3095429 RepID=A0ABU4ULX0_9PSEU|nr:MULTISPECIES: acyltransferase [Lentzea]MDX8140489.1 acyltransferase [Lentzea sp. BCCO 10_0061]
MVSSARPTTPRRSSWDVLRAVAILLVVLQHATWGGPLLMPELGTRPFEMSVQVGASTLMVISAYFVCQTLSSSGAWLLLRNRLGRMLPPFAVASVITYAVTRWFGPDALGRDGDDLVATLLVLPPGLSAELDLVDPSYWTVPLQVLAFVTAAVLWRTRSRNGWRLRMVLWAAVIAPIVISAVVLPLDDSGRLAALHGDLGVHRTHLFAAGAALWLWATGRAGPTLLLLIPAAVGAHHFHTEDLPSSLALGMACGLIATAATGPDWSHPTLRPLIWLAGISYGIYLVNHSIGYTVMYQLQQAGASPTTQCAAMVAASIALGWLLTRAVERPVAKWITTAWPDAIPAPNPTSFGPR